MKVKFTLEQAMKAQRWSKGVYLYTFFNLGTIWGWVVNATPRPFYPEEGHGTHSIEGWVGPRTGLDGCRKSLPHRYSIPDRPVYIYIYTYMYMYTVYVCMYIYIYIYISVCIFPLHRI